MEHTWQSDHLPKLEVSNLEAGDVAVCGSFSKMPRDHVPELDRDRVAFVAPLGSRSDLEWLLRGLHLHPNIRHLVICGDDQRLAGEALARPLATRGSTRTAGYRVPRKPLPGAGCCVGGCASRATCSSRTGEASPSARSRAASRACPFYPPAANRGRCPTRRFPSGRSSTRGRAPFPIFSSGVGDGWLQLLNLALRIGEEKQTIHGERMAEALNAIVTIESPTLEDGGKQVEEEFPDFLDFNQDEFDRLYFPYYDERLHDWDGIDQLEAVCDRLKKSLDTRSGTMVFLEPGDMAKSKVGSGVISATFNAVDQQLCASFVLRSEDLYTDWPLEATRSFACSARSRSAPASKPARRPSSSTRRISTSVIGIVRCEC